MIYTSAKRIPVGRRQNVGEIESGSSPRTVSNNAVRTCVVAKVEMGSGSSDV